MERTGGVVSDAMDLMEQAFLLGLGAASLTKERVEQRLDDLVARGRMSREEGSQLVERLQKRGRVERENLERMMDDAMRRTLESADLARREELVALRMRVERLEARGQHPHPENGPSGVTEPPRW